MRLPTLNSTYLILLSALLLTCLVASSSEAQERAYSLPLVVRMLQNGVAPNVVLNDLESRCVDFRVTQEAEQQLQSVGADLAFLSSLRRVCYVAPGTAVRLQPVNYWNGFKLRSIGYGGGTAVGTILALRKTTHTSQFCNAGNCFDRTVTSAEQRGLGLAIAGISVAGALVDALITSHRSESRPAVALRAHGEPRKSPTWAVRPLLSGSPTGAQIALGRVQF
jgi:hypothetical protein